MSDEKTASHGSLEVCARNFLDHIEACATQSLKAELLVDDDRQLLNYSIERLRPSFNELTRHFIDPQKETHFFQAMYGYEKLWELLAAAFLAGSRGTTPASAKGIIMREVQVERGRKSAEARGGENRPWLRHAKELAIDGRRQNGRLSNIDLAADIKAGWKLADPPAPGVDTLKNYISDLVKAGELPAAIRNTRKAPVH